LIDFKCSISKTISARLSCFSSFLYSTSSLSIIEYFRFRRWSFFYFKQNYLISFYFIKFM